MRKEYLSIQIFVGDCIAERAAIGTEGGRERTGRRSRNRRRFAQTAKAGLERGGIVGCYRDAKSGLESFGLAEGADDYGGVLMLGVDGEVEASDVGGGEFAGEVGQRGAELGKLR